MNFSGLKRKQESGKLPKMRLKYIAFSYMGGSKPLYMIFPDVCKHNNIEAQLKNQLAIGLACKEEDLQAVRAGFVEIHDCVTYGKSVGLGLESNFQDGEILGGQRTGYTQEE
jgi:hypothetical protein